MKYLPLLWAGIMRKPSRTTLLLLQIAVAFLLFGTLQGLTAGIRQVIAEAHVDRLFVASRLNAANTLPVSILETVQSVAHVQFVAPEADLVGTYQKSDQSVPVVATLPDQFFHIYSEYRLSPNALVALRAEQTGVVAGAALMRQYGWKVGDKIGLQTPLPKTDGSRDWTFDIVGSYSDPEHAENADSLVGNFSYLNESRETDRDTIDMLLVKADAPTNAGTVSLTIDTKFANSDHETRTQSEADRLATQIQKTADLDFIVRGIVAATFFALLLATGALMMQSVRERGAELAVLKTLGFRDRSVLVLLLSESVLQCLVAAAIGLGLAFFVLPKVGPQVTQIDVSHIPATVVAAGVTFAALLALISAAAPSIQAARLPIVHALAKR